MAMNQEQDEYLKAFNSDQKAEAPTTEEVDIDMTNMDEGAEPSMTAAEGVEGGVADAVVLGNGQAEAVGEAPAEEAVMSEAEAEGEPVETEQAEMAAGDGDDEMLSPEDQQRQKSWEGRLNKREQELKEREAALGNQPAEVSDAEVEEIRAQLAADFGDEFVGMILKLAAYEARKMAGESTKGSIEPLAQTVADAIAAVQEAFQSQHFSAISEAHEDYSDVVASPEFGQWVESLPDEEKPKIQQVIESGTPGQVIRMLTAYKATLEQGEALSEAEDAATAVRGSSPVTLPSRAPAAADDEYKQAWDQM